MIEMLTIFQWMILALTALCIGMSKTGVQGLMLLAVPYMAMAFGAKESTVVILPMLCIADIIAELSSGMTLLPGTIIATGTPSGVGMGFDPPKFLKSGDVVECEIEKIGTLRNTVR